MVGTISKFISRWCTNTGRGCEPLQKGGETTVELGDALEHDLSILVRKKPAKSALLASQCFVTGASSLTLPLSREKRESLHAELSSLEEIVALEAYAFCVGHVASELAGRQETKDEAA